MPSDHDHIQERLQRLGALQQELQSLKDEYGGEGEVPTEEYQEIFRQMVQVIVEITPCPVHGMPEEVTVALSAAGEEENYELQLEGACCDALREEVSGKLQQLAM